MTDKSARVSTALELKQFLNTIPDGVLERLPLSFITGDGMMMVDIDMVEAFDTTDTEGNIERGLRLNGVEE